MKTIQKISALLAASATLSMAGVINVYTEDAKEASASLNLTTIDSLTFSGKAEKKELNFSGKAKQGAIKLTDIDHVDFKLKDKSKETMTVTVGEGIDEGKHTFKLSEIKNIEIIEMDSDKDTDGDALTDIDEIYKYGTSANNSDTDGDGWSDGEELGGLYSPTNPTTFNPLIADVPGLKVVLKKTPSITLNVETSEDETESVTVSESKEISTTNSVSYEQTRSADIMSSWSLSTTQGWELGKLDGGFGAKWVGSVSAGYEGSYTTSTGMTWSSSEEKSVAQNYERALSNERTNGRTVSGATVCMQVELWNTSNIAFTIGSLRLNASTYDVRDSNVMKIIAELDREGGWSDVTLKSGEKVPMNFCNNNVAVEKIGNLIYNTGALMLGAPTQKITIDRPNCGEACDFTGIYTQVAAQTADITIDYGPGAEGFSSMRYQVATNYRYNPDNKGTEDLHEQTSLADLLRKAHVNFKQDTIKASSKKSYYGLFSVDSFKVNLVDTAFWYVSVQHASDFKKGIYNHIDLYALSDSLLYYDLENIFVGAGDAVRIFYDKDHDRDRIPFTIEHMYGSCDTLDDSDDDKLPDYAEIMGWHRCAYPIDSTNKSACDSTVKFYTNPASKDTDGDETEDIKDSEPTKRPLFKDASLLSLQVSSSATSKAGAKVYLNLGADTLAKSSNFNVAIQAPIAYINVVPSADKVAWVKFTYDTTVVKLESSLGKNVYSFGIPDKLSLLKNTDVTIEVQSEDKVTTKTYKVSISSTLLPPTNLSLAKDTSRSNIIVNFKPATSDTRVSGYVVLRGYKDETLPDNIKNDSPINSGEFYEYGSKSFTVFNVSESGKYVDKVGGGSPYYAYRVYAYAKVLNDNQDTVIVFSKGTEQHSRSVGRIKVSYKMSDFGAEYLYFTGSPSCRADITAKVSLHEGSSNSATKLCTWNAYDYDAGSVGSGNTVIFFSDSKRDSKDREPNYDSHSSNIGSEGLYLNFDVAADCGGRTDNNPSIGIRWPYEKMAKVLNDSTSLATGKNAEAPPKGSVKYLVGSDGIEYDDGNDICSSACGDEPHTGYKFTFNYEWVDDDVTY